MYKKISIYGFCLLFLFMFLFVPNPDPQSAVASQASSNISIPFGSLDDQLGITPAEMQTIREVPTSFFVGNKSIYILDSVKKRIAIYSTDGSYQRCIPLNFLNYPKDILVNSNKNIYILDEQNSAAVVYTLDLEGTIQAETTLPEAVKGSDAKALTVTKGNNVAVADYDYKEYQLNDGKAVMSSDGRTSPYRNKVWKGKLGSDNKMHMISSDGSVDNVLDINALPAGADIVGDDKYGNTYIMVGDMADTSKVILESTIRKFDKDGSQVGVVRLPLETCTNFAHRAINVTENGDVYFMSINDEGVTITPLTFGQTYKSKIIDEQNKELELELESKKNTTSLNSSNNPSSDVSVMTVTANSRSTTYSRSQATTYQYTWYWDSKNNVNPNPSNISRPDFLTTYGYYTGIPYCWGGFDTQDRHSSTAWTNFADAMSKGKFAGNVNCSTSGYQTGTAGVDCSGFVGSAVGYTVKPGTYTLMADTHSHTLTERGQMDIYINSGHVLFFILERTDGTGIANFESTLSGNDKAQQTQRDYTWLSANGYALKSWW